MTWPRSDSSITQKLDAKDQQQPQQQPHNHQMVILSADSLAAKPVATQRQQQQQQETSTTTTTKTNSDIEGGGGGGGCHTQEKNEKRDEAEKCQVQLPGANERDATQELTLIKPTFKRYLILLLYCLNTGNKAFQWISVPAVTTKAALLYGVDNYIINLASIIFMVAFLVLSWPACYIIDTLGLRKAILIASLGTFIGATIKCFSCHENGIWLLMVGLVIVSLSEQLIYSVPSRLASVWFPDHQVSLCVALCVVGNQVGVALGFIIPHWYLRNSHTRDEIGDGLLSMFCATSVFSVIVFIFCVFAFDEEPKMAPGAARLKQRQLEQTAASDRKAAATAAHASEPSMCEKLAELFEQIFRLCHNRQLMLLGASYGIVVGVNWAIQTLLDQMISSDNGDGGEDEQSVRVGETGFTIIVAGILTTPLWGQAMDRWHAYKQINVIIALGNCLSLAAFGCVLVYYPSSTLLIQITAFLYGLFSIGFCVSSLEYAVELTYPAPELVTSSIMNVMPQVGGVLFTLIGSFLVDTYGNPAASSFMVITLLIGLVLVLVTREQRKRQDAIHQMSSRIRHF